MSVNTEVDDSVDRTHGTPSELFYMVLEHTETKKD